MGVYKEKPLPTQSFTKITPYILKIIAFMTSKASKIKARAKETPFINLYSKKYIMINKC